MKKFILFLFTIFTMSNLFSQDVIVKKNGEEIKAKIIEIGVENVKYKKHDNLEGPDYILPKYDIVFVKFENGTKEVFNIEAPSNERSNHIRRGPHLGVHATPGFGKLLNQNMESSFSYNAGLDLNIYFNDYVGIKTGFNYLKNRLKYNVVIHNLNYSPSTVKNEDINGSIKSLGIPVKLIVSSGKKLGIYMEIGLSVNFVTSSGLDVPDDPNIYYISNNSVFYYSSNNGFNASNTTGFNTEPVFLAEEAMLGINYRSSNLVSFNLGVSNHYSLTNIFKNNNETKALFYGLQLGVLFHLPN